jgi:hypothetical protein
LKQLVLLDSTCKKHVYLLDDLGKPLGKVLLEQVVLVELDALDQSHVICSQLLPGPLGLVYMDLGRVLREGLLYVLDRVAKAIQGVDEDLQALLVDEGLPGLDPDLCLLNDVAIEYPVVLGVY